MKRRIFYIVGIMVALLIIAEREFLWKNLMFTFVPPKDEQVQSDRTRLDPEASTSLPPNTLEIPSLGITAPVQYVDEQSEKVFQKALRDGVVHYPGTAKPGQYGNVYIFGHSSDYLLTPGKYKTVFALLPRIKKDAEINITTAEGQLFTYKVTDNFVAEANRLDLLDQHNNEKALLTLQTSWPLGTALKRYIVVAELAQN